MPGPGSRKPFAAVIGEGDARTADLGGTSGTKAYGHAVAERVRALEAAA